MRDVNYGRLWNISKRPTHYAIYCDLCLYRCKASLEANFIYETPQQQKLLTTNVVKTEPEKVAWIEVAHSLVCTVLDNQIRSSVAKLREWNQLFPLIKESLGGISKKVMSFCHELD